MILAIDPGWNLLSWAIGDQTLIKTGQTRLVGDPEDRFVSLAAYIRQLLVEYYIDHVVIEKPTTYHSKNVDPESVLKISLIAGVCAGCVRLPLTMPTAPEWKGTVPKKIHNNRVLSELTRKEKKCLGVRCDHNIIDAVGIWLWYEKNKEV